MSISPSDTINPGSKPGHLAWLLPLSLALLFASGTLIAYLFEPIPPQSHSDAIGGRPGEAMVSTAQLDAIQQRITELDQRVAELAGQVAVLPARSPTTPTTAQTNDVAVDQPQDQESPINRILTSLGTRHQERGPVVTLGEQELQFAPGKAKLPTARPPSLNQLKSLLDQDSQMELLIEGHTDSKGQATTNQALSARRAEAVKSALIDLGADSKRIHVQGHGATRPIADNRTPEGRRSNRRIEIYLMKSDDK
jgi:outer membrane protein OmpA-like peptidoglycan-associated protein